MYLNAVEREGLACETVLHGEKMLFLFLNLVFTCKLAAASLVDVSIHGIS